MASGGRRNRTGRPKVYHQVRASVRLLLSTSKGRSSMKKAVVLCLGISAALLSSGLSGAQAQQNDMTFFLTSAGPGKGGALGGVEGADRHCQTLAQAGGAGSKTWHAYLSTQAAS